MCFEAINLPKGCRDVSGCQKQAKKNTSSRWVGINFRRACLEEDLFIFRSILGTLCGWLLVSLRGGICLVVSRQDLKECGDGGRVKS